MTTNDDWKSSVPPSQNVLVLVWTRSTTPTSTLAAVIDITAEWRWRLPRHCHHHHAITALLTAAAATLITSTNSRRPGGSLPHLHFRLRWNLWYASSNHSASLESVGVEIELECDVLSKSSAKTKLSAQTQYLLDLRETTSKSVHFDRLSWKRSLYSSNFLDSSQAL